MLNFVSDCDKYNTCIKEDGSCIYLANCKYSFKFPATYETGLNDHYHLIYSMLKATFQKEKPKTVIWRDFKMLIQIFNRS